MPNHRWVCTVAWLMLCACSAGVLPAASTFLRSGVPYAIDIWDEDLPEHSVISMIQTQDGYLWLGTLNGLVRFDGLQFTVFDESNTPGLNSSRVVHLFEDSRENLWVGTETAGLAMVKDGHVTSVGLGQGTQEERLVSATEDATGAVWLCTAQGQLWRHKEGRLARVVINTNTPSAYKSVVAEAGGTVWVGTDTGVSAIRSTLDPGSIESAVEQSQPVGRFDFLLASPRGGHWLLADGRIQKWITNRMVLDWPQNLWGIPTRATNVATASGFEKKIPVMAACEDRDGNLVVGTSGAGVFWFDAEGKATSISTNEGLSHNYVLSLLVDREGTLWVGTDGRGLNRVKRQVFDVLKDAQGWVVQSICEDKAGGLWIGSHGTGVAYWKESEQKTFDYSRGLFPYWVKSVFADRNREVWAGTYRSGLFQWSKGVFRPAPGAGALDRDVSVIHQDRKGRLWVGTQGGLACREERAWKVFTTRDGLTSDAVRAVADDPEGNVWVGTAGGGLNRLREGRFTSFRKADELPSPDISSLLVDDDGVLWVGTRGGGLARYHGGKWTRYSTREGLVSNSVGYLIEDGQGYLWIGSNAGLMRAPKKALNDFARGLAAFIPFRVYGTADGLPTRECTSGSQPAACRTREGRLWFPTIRGAASVNPAQLNSNTNPPPVMIESVLIEGQPQTTNGLRARLPQTLTFPAGQERVEIHYTSLNLTAPDRARFKYRLESYETAWNFPKPEAGNTRSAIYRKLPAGHYRFQVTACNEDGVWNEAGRSLAFVVQPPIWRTWWFLSGLTAGLLGLIIAMVHYFSTQKLHRQLERLRQQEALEKERSRIARDIHDQLGASLTQVALLGELVEADKDAPVEVEAHARQISQTARDTTRVLDEIVWTVNPSNDTLEGLINYICTYAQEYLAVAGLRYRLDVPAQLPAVAIPPEVRHNVFLASKESVTNVVRHARASEVWIRLRLEPVGFTLEIEDNGRGVAGLDPNAPQTRNGLRNMQRRMKDVGGSFSIGPAPGGGALIRLAVPLGSR